MTLIVGSSELSKKQLRAYAKEARKIIAADGGLEHLMSIGAHADLILGDFDSYKGELPDKATVFPKEKDFSDMKAALNQVGDEETVLLGVTGGRLDHFLSVTNLLYGRENIRIIDEQNELFYRKDAFSLKKREGYFSLFPSEPMEITIQGTKYNLTKRKIL